ncbi:MAG: DUF192 domain-containing protein, partial [Phycisphaerae bacterium]|nr:DUF192 domain-containing protein [Phycisphaerae bacterium]
KFWMQGCLIPLDVAFISSDKRVVKIHTMAVEPDLAGWNLYSSQVPAQYALEVSAGMFQRVGVRVGDAVTFSGDIPEAAKAEDGP